MAVIRLGAYQTLELESVDLSEQFTNGGLEPFTLVAKLTTPMDDHFKLRTTTALLSEEDQRKIINALQKNLNGIPPEDA